MRPSLFSVLRCIFLTYQQPIYENSPICLQFSAGYLFLMLSFTLTDSINFLLIVYNSTCLNMALLPSTSESCRVPFLARCLLRFWERVCHLNCCNMSLASRFFLLLNKEGNQQWRILTIVFPLIFILYCLSQCVCSTLICLIHLPLSLLQSQDMFS